MVRLFEKYKNEIVPKLLKENKYSSVMQVPKITKVTVNCGLGEATQNQKVLESAVEEMTIITGQKPVITKARKSISNFKLREGMPIGCCVTLRREMMYQFLDRLFSLAMPRIRDFRGINPKGFDGHGNFNMGLKEQLVFPEIEYDKVEKIRGMNISFTTSARTDDEARQLLEELGMPFRK
jgi:large subunit ribosomal protein L5